MNKMLKSSGIYKILNNKTGDCYIGSAVDISRRWKLHLSSLHLGTHANCHLQRAWEKYGCHRFFFSVLEFVERKEDLLAREQLYLDTEKPKYNIYKTAGSPLGVRFSDEVRRKVSAAGKGRKHSEDTKRKIGLGNKGKIITDEQRLATSKRMKGVKTWLGKHRSEVTKEKISRALTGHVYNLGHPVAEETKRKISESHKRFWEAKKAHSATNPNT